MSFDFTDEDIEQLRIMIESMKESGRTDLSQYGIRSPYEIYEDPLPNDGALKRAQSMRTSFLIGRKGTGKTTILLQVIDNIKKLWVDGNTDSYVIPVYINAFSVKDLVDSHSVKISVWLTYVTEIKATYR